MIDFSSDINLADRVALEAHFADEAGDWLVCTNESADKVAREYILEGVWAFNMWFLRDHFSCELSDRAVKALEKVCSDLCEDANPLFLDLIKDHDAFVNDAIMTDGRGHFISHYDGQEVCVPKNGKVFFAYRTN